MNTAEANGINRTNQVGNKAMNYVILKLWNRGFDDECWVSKSILLKNDADLNVNAREAITEYAILQNTDKPKSVLPDEMLKDIANYSIEKDSLCEYTNSTSLVLFCYDSESKVRNHLEAIAIFTNPYNLIGRTSR